MFKSKTIRYSLEKNEILKSGRDISFEDVILALESGVPYQNIIQMLIHQFASNKIQMNI